MNQEWLADYTGRLSGEKSPDFFLTAKCKGSTICYTNYTYYTERVEYMDALKGKYAWTATVGEKGQIVIPKQAREVFGIKPGDTLILLGDEEHGIAIPPKESFGEWYSKIFSENKGD